MIIKKIHVGNFGKLSDFELELNDGLNVIYAPNESGKSTLLSFIKFVFYGSKIKKSRNELTFKEKYMPWNGMPMSGSVEFEADGKQYVIYRSEGHKNGGKVFWIKNPLNGEDYCDIDDAGKYFFHVGEAGFSESCFVDEVQFDASDSQLVGALTGNCDESSSYDKAGKTLEERILALGSLKRKDSQLAKIMSDREENLAALVAVERELERHKESVSRVEKAKKELRITEDEIEDLINQQKIIESYDDFLRLKSLEDSLAVEEKNNCTLCEKINAVAQQSADESTLPYTADKKSAVVCGGAGNTKYLLFTFAAALLSGIGAFKTEGTVGYMFAALTVLLFVVFGFMLYRCFCHNQKSAGHTDNGSEPVNGNTNDTNDELVRSLAAQKKLSDERINSIRDEIKRLKSSEKIKTIIDSTELIDINCFTNEEINDIIYSKGIQKDRLISEIARLDAQGEKYAGLVAEAEKLRANEQSYKAVEAAINEKINICRTALDILNASYIKLKDNIAPGISKRAYEILSSVARNELTAVYTNESLGVGVRFRNEIKDAKAFSTGTRDLIGLSLRIAVCDYLGRVPMFFDDVLSSFDDERAERMLYALEQLSCRRQLVLCTCRRRERDYFDSKASVNIINMRKEETNG